MSRKNSMRRLFDWPKFNSGPADWSVGCRANSRRHNKREVYGGEADSVALSSSQSYRKLFLLHTTTGGTMNTAIYSNTVRNTPTARRVVLKYTTNPIKRWVRREPVSTARSYFTGSFL